MEKPTADVHPSSSQTTFTPPPLTQDQYTQLLHLLSNQGTSSDHNSPADVDNKSSGLVAGNQKCFLSSVSPDTWVIDSGASDHITPNFSLMHSTKTVTNRI